ncbi:pentatricopeptide repeat-containing protein [Trifolium pratense]|uniref:Pentatricopeptide repeat-containing protein n=1 Tax=Trifolium pratense TaxID=57577 RepID=A0A2K3KVL2_TRIPR|nr:pentatricopeptide repeat-containing protein [Trifolium pratense]
MLSINTITPSIEGNYIKIGAINCFIDSVTSQSTVHAFSSPIKIECQHDGNVQFSQDHDHNSKKGETLSDLLLCSSENIAFFSHYRDFGIIVFDPGGALLVLLSYAICRISFCLRWIPWDRGKKPFDIGRNLLSMITEKQNQEKVA